MRLRALDSDVLTEDSEEPISDAISAFSIPSK